MMDTHEKISDDLILKNGQVRTNKYREQVHFNKDYYYLIDKSQTINENDYFTSIVIEGVVHTCSHNNGKELKVGTNGVINHWVDAWAYGKIIESNDPELNLKQFELLKIMIEKI